MLVDLRPRGLTGPMPKTALDHAAITVNKNAIPFDTEPITKTGGIRVGTPAMTTRGMKEEEMMEIADLIHTALENRTDSTRLAALRQEVVRFTSRFPAPETSAQSRGIDPNPGHLADALGVSGYERHIKL